MVSTHYRQAPEHKFPAAHDDTWAAYEWVLKNAKSFNGDASRVALAGESAGGNMAAAIALMARDRKAQMPVHQLLIYPVTNPAEAWRKRVSSGHRPDGIGEGAVQDGDGDSQGATGV